MARKRAHEHADERWLLTYADMITLLMALFMVMFSMAVVNKGKFDELAKSLQARASPARSTGGGTSILNVGTSNPTAQANSELSSPPHPIQAEQRPAASKDEPSSGSWRTAQAIVQAKGLEAAQARDLQQAKDAGRPKIRELGLDGQGRDGDQLEGPRDPPDHRQGAVRHRLVHDPARGAPAAELRRAGRERHRHEPDPRRGAHGRRAVPRTTRTATSGLSGDRAEAVLFFLAGPRFQRPSPPRHRIGGLRLARAAGARTIRRPATARATAASRSWCSASTT